MLLVSGLQDAIVQDAGPISGDSSHHCPTVPAKEWSNRAESCITTTQNPLSNWDIGRTAVPMKRPGRLCFEEEQCPDTEV